MSDSITPYAAWNNTIRSTVPRLLAESDHNPYSECIALHTELSRGEGEWEQMFEEKRKLQGSLPFVLDVPNERSPKYRTRLVGTMPNRHQMYLSIVQGIENFTSDSVSFMPPCAEVLTMWEELSTRTAKHSKAIVNSNYPDEAKLQMIALNSAFYYALSLVIHPMIDGNKRMLFAWNVLQFKRLGYDLVFPFEGVENKLPRGNNLNELQRILIINLLYFHRLPVFDNFEGVLKDINFRGRSIEHNVGTRRSRINLAQYDRSMATAIRKEINPSKGSFLTPHMETICKAISSELLSYVRGINVEGADLSVFRMNKSK